MATSLNAPLHVELQSQVGGNMAFVPAAIAAGATLGAGALNYLGARQANQMNMKIAKKQMHFQERMSNTAYQRTVEDMRAAGLNPALAYNLGGASSPMGSSTNVGNELSGAVNSALDAQRAFAEVKNLEETNKNLQSQNKLIAAQRRQADSQSEFNTTSAARLSASFPLIWLLCRLILLSLFLSVNVLIRKRLGNGLKPLVIMLIL